MIGIDYETAEKNHLIRIKRFDGKRYETLFYLPDGGTLAITRSDGKTSECKCTYIDPYHFYCGNECLHIDQFADFMQRAGNTVAQRDFLTDPLLFSKKYMDRDLKDAAGNLIPYRCVISTDTDYHDTFSVSVCDRAASGKAFSVHNPEDAKIHFFPCLETTLQYMQEQSIPVSDYDKAALMHYARENVPEFIFEQKTEGLDFSLSDRIAAASARAGKGEVHRQDEITR